MMIKYLPFLALLPFVIACGDNSGDASADVIDTAVVENDSMVEVEADTSFHLGEASLIAVGCPDVAASRAFYEELGFHAIQEGLEPTPWSWMSDSSLLIGLFSDANTYLGFSYFTEDLHAKTARLKAAGFHFDGAYDDGVQMEVWLSPDRQVGIAIIEQSTSRLYQPEGATFGTIMQSGNMMDASLYPNPVCGAFSEFAIPCSNLDSAMTWWKAVGFEVLLEEYGGAEPYAILSDGFQVLGIHQTEEFDYNAITYFWPDASAAIAKIEAAGLPSDEMPAEWAGKHAVLNSPEGQKFNIFSLQ